MFLRLCCVMLNFPFHRGWRIAVISGIPVYLEFSCLIALSLWTSALSGKFAYVLPGSGWGMGFLAVVLMYTCIFLHELGHAFAGRHYGMKVDSIVIHGMGGVAYLLGTHRTPRQLLEVSIAGSMVNLILFVILSLVSAGFKETEGFLPLMVEQIKNFNLFILLFNLLPIPPLDGGQVLRAIQWQWAGRFLEINRSLSILGYGIGITAIALGIFLYIHTSFTGIWLIFLGIWVCSMNKIETAKSQNNPSSAKTVPENAGKTAAQTSNKERSVTFWSYLEAPFLEMEGEVVFQSSMKYLKEIRCREAIAAFTEALQTRPSSAQGFYNRGIAYLRVGQLQEALADFKTALRLNPDLSEAHLGKGNVYAELNDLETAIESYNQRLEASPDDAVTLFNRATAYAELGDNPSAIGDYQHARILFSDRGDIITAQKILGRLQRLNEMDKPLDLTQTKTKNTGASNDEPDPLVRDKLLRLLKQDREMAERLIAQAKQKNPNQSEAWYWEKVLWDLERDRFR